MIIKVRQKHIDEGVRKTAGSCPVAKALDEQTDCDYNYVYNHSIKYNGRNVHMPRSVQRFVKKFDSGRPVKPFNFILKTK